MPSTFTFCNSSGDRLVLDELASQHDVDAVPRQDEAGDAKHVVHADGHRAHAGRYDGGQRRALAGTGHLVYEDEFVRLDRLQRDARLRSE